MPSVVNDHYADVIRDALTAILNLASGDYASGLPRCGHGQIAPDRHAADRRLALTKPARIGERSAKGSQGAISSRQPMRRFKMRIAGRFSDVGEGRTGKARHT